MNKRSQKQRDQPHSPDSTVDRRAVNRFRPHPLLAGAHRQTIAGLLLSGRIPRMATRCQEVPLPDGDRLAIHIDRASGDDLRNQVVVLVHGLAGCHDSAYVARTAGKLVTDGFHSVRVDLRGCGAGKYWAKHVFHAGRSDDVRAIVDHLLTVFPVSDIKIVGYSMGAHLLLRYLGETGNQVPSQVRAAMAVAPPVDLSRCCDELRKGPFRPYDRFFALSLWRYYRQRLRAGLVRDSNAHRRPRSLREFDQLVTAPLAGFESAAEYYAATSSYRTLKSITIPTHVVSAADDPMIPIDMLRSVERSPAVQLHFTVGGGHLGFIADRDSSIDGQPPDRRWLDWHVVQWAGDPTSFAYGGQ